MATHNAIAIYHFFTVLCYFMPVLGAILSDGFLGLYKTILYLSVVYVFGEAILTITRYLFIEYKYFWITARI